TSPARSRRVFSPTSARATRSTASQPLVRAHLSTRSTTTRSAGSTSSTTTSSSRARSGGRGLTPLCCGCARPGAGWPGRSNGPRIGEREPREAGRAAVLDAARNVACTGGEPLALTDCLNFGNPEKPEIGWELAEAIEGIAEAAEALGIPVVSGNVSLYNETD